MNRNKISEERILYFNQTVCYVSYQVHFANIKILKQYTDIFNGKTNFTVK